MEKEIEEIEGKAASILLSQLKFVQKVSDDVVKYLTTCLGKVSFFIAFSIFIFTWMLVNSGSLTGIKVFDVYPYNLLIMILQFFSVFLTILILINQNTQEKITSVRQQVAFEITVRAEQEITKVLEILDELRKEVGIFKYDKELEKMKEKSDLQEIKEEIETL